jgi:hypothetical protein
MLGRPRRVVVALPTHEGRCFPKRVVDSVGAGTSSPEPDWSGVRSTVRERGAIPYVAAMAPIVDDGVRAGGGSDQANGWWAPALVTELGGIATTVVASENVVVAIGIGAPQRPQDLVLALDEVRPRRGHGDDRRSPGSSCGSGP